MGFNATTIVQLTAGAAVRGRVDREPVARNVSGAAPARGGVAALLRDGTPTAYATTSSSSSLIRLRLVSRTGLAAVEFVSPSLAASLEVLEMITAPSAMAPAADGTVAGTCGRMYCHMLRCDADIRARTVAA